MANKFFWEYLAVPIVHTDRQDILLNNLKRAGDDGWELVAITPDKPEVLYPQMIFKRRAAVPPVPWQTKVRLWLRVWITGLKSYNFIRALWLRSRQVEGHSDEHPIGFR